MLGFLNDCQRFIRMAICYTAAYVTLCVKLANSTFPVMISYICSKSFQCTKKSDEYSFFGRKKAAGKEYAERRKEQRKGGACNLSFDVSFTLD